MPGSVSLRPTVTRVDESTPQSVTLPLRQGISAVALETPASAGPWQPARQPLQPQSAESDASIDSTPRRVVTAADILRAGGGMAAAPALPLAAPGHSALPEVAAVNPAAGPLATGAAIADPMSPPSSAALSPPSSAARPPPPTDPTDPPLSQPLPLEEAPPTPTPTQPQPPSPPRSDPALEPSQPPSHSKPAADAAPLVPASPAKRSGERLSPPRAGAAGGCSVSQLQLPGARGARAGGAWRAGTKRDGSGAAAGLRQGRGSSRVVCGSDGGFPLRLRPRRLLQGLLLRRRHSCGLPLRCTCVLFGWRVARVGACRMTV